MVTGNVLHFMNGTIQPVSIGTAEDEAYSQAPAKLLSCEHSTPTQCLCGENSSTTAGKSELTAPYSVMRATIKVQTLSDRLTPLLISRGLVRGIIPMSMRKRCGQQMLDTAFFAQAGDDADELKMG